MKAAFLIGESQFEVRDIPAPEPPPDGILLKVVTCGVCGSDLRRWKEGPYPGSDRLVPGHEVAGIIEAVGSEVKDYRSGERLAVAPDGSLYVADSLNYRIEHFDATGNLIQAFGTVSPGCPYAKEPPPNVPIGTSSNTSAP